jgi:hypothetical protein
MIEAADRIGGRAITESATFGQPYDLGCSWLQGPETLPHLALARARGFGLVDFGTAKDAQFLGNQRATAAERRAYERSWDRIEAALERAMGRDVAASTVIPAISPTAPLCRAGSAPWITASILPISPPRTSTSTPSLRPTIWCARAWGRWSRFWVRGCPCVIHGGHACRLVGRRCSGGNHCGHDYSQCLHRHSLDRGAGRWRDPLYARPARRQARCDCRCAHGPAGEGRTDVRRRAVRAAGRPAS